MNDKISELLISLQINQRLFREIVNQLSDQTIGKQFDLILDNNDRIINEFRNVYRNNSNHKTERPVALQQTSGDNRVVPHNQVVSEPSAEDFSEKKRYVCQWPGCEYGTNFRANLNKHLSKHSSDKRYVCDWPECAKRYKQWTALAAHKRSHLNLKPFACDFIGCHYRTNNRSSLPGHKRTHTGVKPFACEWTNCSVSCSSLSHLRDHQMSHRKEKPFKCDVCDQCFAKKCNMTAHKNSVHMGVKRVRKKTNTELQSNDSVL